MGFISINEELTPEERKLKQEKWMLLRQRHLDKLGTACFPKLIIKIL